jgi:flagellar hook-associated protein 2
MAISSSTSIINTLGAGSGIDINNLAQGLVDAEKIPQKDRLDAKIAQTEAKITGFSVVKFALSELKNAFGKLNDANDFSAIVPANTQATTFGVTASSTAGAGSYSLEVLQTALAQRSASSSFGSNSEVLNGGAAFSLNLSIAGADPTTIEVSTATPDGVVKAINSADLGVTAQIINTGSGFTIVVSGQTGAQQSFTLGSDDGTGTGVTGLAFDTALQSAADASFKINGLSVTRSSNTVNDVIDGVTLELFANTTGAARLDLNRDTTAIKSNISGLVAAYNDFEDTLKILSDRSSEVEEFGGVLAGESLLRTIRNQVRDMLTRTSSTAGSTIQAARDVGLSIDRNGKLNLDESQLDAALQNNFSEVSTMFSAGTNNQSIYSTADAGLAGDAINRIEKMLLSSGAINTQSLSAASQVKQYQTKLTELEERMDKLLNRYIKQFSVMESIVGSSNTMRESLKSTFEGMMKAYTN